jgi:transposase
LSASLAPDPGRHHVGTPGDIISECLGDFVGIRNSWSKEFLEAGKRRLAGDTARAATTDEVKQLRREAQDLKEVVAEQALELRLLKKSMIADGGDQT